MIRPIRYFQLLTLPAGLAWGAAPLPIEFNRDIRPILSENCFQCHGQDAERREAKLRLDDPASSTRDRDGYAVIVPGQPGKSELLLRIMSTDEDEMMPPRDSNKHLTTAQKEVLRRWIAEGAQYQKHWSLIPPQRPPLPAVRDTKWARNGVDRFVLARLEREGLAPSPATTPATWLRRASLDLTGLPPTPQELDAFAADVNQRGEPAYSAAADRLLQSVHFGERLAMEWLDAARYADTHGYNNDSSRTMWRWRDWVIDAFNAGMPYDQFITEQLAGDLLPKPTLEQRIATGFGRNHIINSEGGIIDEEYRVEYVADRVRTVSTAWLGLTMECARCHDHKFDPIQQRDYYRLFAFFNNVPEHGEDGRAANAVPMMPAPTREQQAALGALEQELSRLTQKLPAMHAPWQWRDSDKDRITALVEGARAAVADEPGVDVLTPEPAATKPLGKTSAATSGDQEDDEDKAEPETVAKKIPAARLNFRAKGGITLSLWLRPDADNPRDVALISALNHRGSPVATQYGRGRELRLIEGELELRLSDRFPIYSVTVRTEGAGLRPGALRHVALTYDGGKKAAGIRFFVDGTEVRTVVRYDDLYTDPGQRDFLVGTDNAEDAAKWRGTLDEFRSFPRLLSSAQLRALFHARALPHALSQLGRGVATGHERAWLRDALLASEDATRERVARRTAVNEEILALRRSFPTVMVMQELPPRPAFILNRGQYDQPGEPVEAGVPEALLGAWPEGAPRNRLGLARWITRADHPLTARVVVNRFWAQLFGTGLVKTLEDFGSQSEWPSHPELLDWLAREFVDGGWNVKEWFKTAVLSATYRQSSAVSPALLALDPENRLFARGPRVRLPAEIIRDQALAISGLLARRIGGPSVYPYQPEKLYEGIVVGVPFPGSKWGVSTGADLYRRSLYTYWKRTVPHPVMTAFDAPDREFCTVRRSRTNTPLQALTLWNEPGFLEAARQLATRMLREGGTDDVARVTFVFHLATGRRPNAKETRVLIETFSRLRVDFIANGHDAYAFVKAGTSPLDATFAPAEFAAAMGVASMILSLDETITKN